ncbi:MAG TPA: hypothetical protein VN519_13040 [Bryobacteraceae bacterium]|nr:hypothetical protein [Bryobacteraceae bacterium]
MTKSILFALLLASAASALDFRGATVVVPAGASLPEKTAAKMLTEEITKRTQFRLKTSATMPILGPAILIRTGTGPAAEGFSLTSSAEGSRPIATVRGADARGVIFGTGYLLRQLKMGRQQLELAGGLNLQNKPKIAIRGHQLGYRPKTNSYDGWDVPQWEQYIRELAIFGTNTIELIPPRSDDAADSPHFALPQIEMMAEQSRIANEYAMDVSIWYPAMDKDYSDPATVEFALKEWGDVFRKLPRVDAVFVPGGDPGHTEPKYLLALLEKETEVLHRYHPNAQMWVSPQSFDQAWLDEFYGILDKQPGWLTGVVFGPQVRGSIEQVRARVPKRYKLRFYPDITHSRQSEFPVEDWDFAYSTTEAREVINPRPVAEAAIFHRYIQFSNGFVTYSEGCNDDFNKILWSSLGWNPDAKIEDIAHDYAQYFIGADMADEFAKGILSLERDWKGSLAANTGVDQTLALFQSLEKRASPQQKENWRFQQGLYRAYYDAFERKRLLIETDQEKRALTALKTGGTAAARKILDADELTPEARELRARVFELAEALFQSIHMQLSVQKYQAISLGRGANLDSIDFALNDRVWLENEFAKIDKAPRAQQAAMISRIVNWTDAGPGGFYDDLGDTTREPHMVRGESYDRDPDFLQSAFTGFGDVEPRNGARASWYTTAETLGETPLRMHYPNLDTNAQYILRVVYGGDTPRVQLKLMANGKYQIHDFRAKPTPQAPLEFEIPKEATSGGDLTLEWSRPAGLGGAGRGTQVCEVWLIRKN